jgi:pimeloyl-ACP methyl ester carboxylesterase
MHNRDNVRQQRWLTPGRAVPTAFVLLLIFSLGTVLGQTIWLSGLLLPNLLPQTAFRPLEWVTRTPRMVHVAIPYSNGYLNADLYVPAEYRDDNTVLLAIHGVNENGKDDPRLVNAGQSFARAGLITLIPDFPDISPQRFTPLAHDEIVSAYSWLTRRFAGKRSGMIAFSVAAGPMFLAAADERISHRIDYLISFGGYYEMKEVLRNVTTGAHRDPYGLWVANQQDTDLFRSDETFRRLLDNTDPAQFDALFSALSPRIQQFIGDLSPAGKLDGLRAKKVFLLHGDPDPLVPTGESARLHQALGGKADLIVLRSVSHVTLELPKWSWKDVFDIYLQDFFKLYGVVFHNLNL